MSRGDFTNMTKHEDDGKVEDKIEAHGGHVSTKDNGGISGFINRFLSSVLNAISKTLRSFVSFTMAIFFLGALFGYFVPQFAGKLGMDVNLILAVPLLLSILSYYFTEVAVLVFLLMFGLFLLFFL